MGPNHPGALVKRRTPPKRTANSLSFALCAIVALVLSSVGAASSSAQTGPIRLGAVLPLSGNAAFVGTGARIGIRAALQKINNEEGGVHGRKLEVVFEDTRSDPKLIVSAYRKLTEGYNPPAVLTALTSTANLLMPIANEEGRLLFVESSKPGLLAAPGFILRSFYTTDQTNEALVSALKAKFLNVQEMENKVLHLAVLYNNEDWAKATVDDLQAKLSNSRIVLDRQPFRPGDENMKPTLLKMQKQHPDALFVVSLGHTAASIYKQLAQTPVAAETYGFAACHDDDLFAAAKGALEGVYGVGPRLDRKGPLYERLSKIYQEERPGEPVDMTSISMFNAVLILAEALKARAETPLDMRRFIFKQKEFEGIAGKVVFDANGDAKWKASVERISNGACLPIPE